MNIHQKLKNARIHAELTQEAVISQLGISRQTLSNWENGRSSPDIHSVLKLSDLYGISLDALLREDTQAKKEDVPFLKRYWGWIYEAAVVCMILSLLGYYYQSPILALTLQLLGLLIFLIPRLLFLRLFGGSIWHILPGVLGWCLEILCFWLYDSVGSTVTFYIYLLYCIGGGLIIITTNRESPFRNLHKPHIYTMELIAVCVVLAVVLSDAIRNTGGLRVPAAFGHTFHAASVIYPENYDGKTWLVELDKGTSDVTLCLIDPQTQQRSKIGSLQKSPSGWQVLPKDSPEQLYRLVTEPEDYVTLAYFCDDVLQWKYQLARIDTLRCILTSGENSVIWDADWYAESPEPESLDTFPVTDPSQLHFMIDDPGAETLTIHEEYYWDGNTEYTTYTLDTVLNLSRRYTTGEQHGIYRIPYQGGAYVFRIDYQ